MNRYHILYSVEGRGETEIEANTEEEALHLFKTGKWTPTEPEEVVDRSWADIELIEGEE